MDKATQLSLGLNHGLPTWYKRAHAIQLRPEPQASPPSPTQTRTAGPWRRTDTPSGHSTGLSLDSGISPSPRRSIRHLSSLIIVLTAVYQLVNHSIDQTSDRLLLHHPSIFGNHHHPTIRTPCSSRRTLRWRRRTRRRTMRTRSPGLVAAVKPLSSS